MDEWQRLMSKCHIWELTIAVKTMHPYAMTCPERITIIFNLKNSNWGADLTMAEATYVRNVNDKDVSHENMNGREMLQSSIAAACVPDSQDWLLDA